MGGPLNGVNFKYCGWTNFTCIHEKFSRYIDLFSKDFQSHNAPAGYFRMPELGRLYALTGNILSVMNNEGIFNKQIKEKFMSVDKFMFIIFEKEQVIHPAESSWWGDYDFNYNVVHRNQTDLFKGDLIGLKQLEAEGRTVYISLPGFHCEVSNEEIDTVLIPFLQQ